MLDDIDDELLALAGDGAKSQKPRKKRPPPAASHHAKSSTKRRKAERDDLSGDDPESEEDGEPEMPYPLEGKYVDENDRQRLMQMSEIEREDILAQRLEEMQPILDKRNLDQMLKAQAAGAMNNSEEDSVSKAAKRQHTVRGATKEKTKKLDELKARRRAKDEKKRTKTRSPKRERSSSPMELETSGDEEDGQITKFDEEEEKLNKATAKPVEDEVITLEDLDKCRLTRNILVKHCMAPWFDEYVKGCWIRYCLGSRDDGQVYRICEIQGLSPDPVKPYKINDRSYNHALALRHGASVRTLSMDGVSNAPFTEKEFERVVDVWKDENVKLPTKLSLEKKVAHMAKVITTPMTESDITAMLARKNQLANKHSAASITMEKARLTQARTLAMRRHDSAELAELDAKLAELAELAPKAHEDADDMLTKVNERNRKANVEAVRQAELREAERKRRERKLALQGGSGAGTPGGLVDPSARLKTVPRLFNTASPRPGTPTTPVLAPTKTVGGAAARPISPLPLPAEKTKGGGSFEASIIDSIEVNLVDF